MRIPDFSIHVQYEETQGYSAEVVGYGKGASLVSDDFIALMENVDRWVDENLVEWDD